MSVINTNITSMIGQANLSKSQGALQTSMERLSSGLRINSAKDDAAGQAIANRMTAQITGLNQASRNANDGISVAQTAEGALNQINDNVQRIRELAVQAANGSNSQADLGSIQDEIGQRLSEIDRISEQTDFNGTKVLDSGVSPMEIQVGANDGEIITIELKTVNKDTLEIGDFNVRGVEQPGNASFADGDEITIDGTTYTHGTVGNDDDGTAAFAAAPSFDTTAAAPEDLGTPTLVETSAGTYYAKVGTGADAEFYEVEFSVGTAGVDGTGTETGSAAVLNFSIKGGADAVAVDAQQAGITDVEADVVAKTENPLEQLDNALSQIDSLRSELGAVQNRFEDAITNLNTNSTNLSEARSRIEDADYAEEVANMTRAQILQQAGTSVLAQANQIPQNVLSLLG